MEKNIIRCMDSIARKAIKSITMIMVLAAIITLGVKVDVKAETNSNVVFYLSRQPANVQAHLVKQGVNIKVLDQLDWSSPDLASTWAYTSMYGDPVYQIDIVLQKGMESSLTHEVGHCISNLGTIPHYWDRTPEFQALCAAESKNSIYAAQGWDNPVEYFACAYQMYIDYPQVLMKFHPQTYKYIQAVVAQTN